MKSLVRWTSAGRAASIPSATARQPPPLKIGRADCEQHAWASASTWGWSRLLPWLTPWITLNDVNGCVMLFPRFVSNRYDIEDYPRMRKRCLFFPQFGHFINSSVPTTVFKELLNFHPSLFVSRWRWFTLPDDARIAIFREVVSPVTGKWQGGRFYDF